MKSTILGMFGVAILWSSGAAADPFVACTDAANYGYNTVAYFLRASYKKANCDSNLASEYEQFLTDILPMYLANMAKQTTDEKSACMLQGSYESWLDTVQDEYADCQGIAASFQVIQRRLVGTVAGSLFESFYGVVVPTFYTPAIVAQDFAYPYASLPLVGTTAQCEAEIRGAVSGVSQELVTALVVAACQ